MEGGAPGEVSTVSQDREPVRRGAEYVGAGAVYLALSALFFLIWLDVNWNVVLFLSLPTCVAGLVLLGVGWPRWQRERSPRAADHRQPIAHTPHRVRRS
jgi:hypothetical protein